MSIEPAQSSQYPIVDALEKIKLQPLSTEGKAAVKSLFFPGLKHILAVKLNNFTGEKFECFCNLEKDTGKALLSSVNKAFSPIINKELEKIKDKASETLDGVKTILTAYAQEKLNILNKELVASGVKLAFRVSGLEQTAEICRSFINIACGLLAQSEKGAPQQTVTRLLTIIGALYTGNEDVKAIIDKTKETLFEEFFKENGILSHILKNNLGKLSFLAGFIEKLVIALGVKQFVDNFLTNRILQQQNSADIAQNGDVYEKLILKGVSIFIDNTEGKNLDLDTLLKDEKLDEGLRGQLQEIKELYSDSKLTRFTLCAENSLAAKLLSHFKDRDIIHMTREDLKMVLVDIGKEYVDDGIAVIRTKAKDALSAGAEIAGTVLGATYRLVKVSAERATDIVLALADKAGQALSAAKDMVMDKARAAKDALCSAYDRFFGKSKTDAKEGGEVAESQSEVKANQKAVEGTEKIAIDETERKVSIREMDDSVEITTKGVEVLQDKKDLEGDFVEYLQDHFREETTSTQKTIEQNSEEGTGIGGAALNAGIAVVDSACELVQGGWSLLKRAATGVYDYFASSPSENITERSVSEVEGEALPKAKEVSSEETKGVSQAGTVTEQVKTSDENSGNKGSWWWPFG